MTVGERKITIKPGIVVEMDVLELAELVFKTGTKDQNIILDEAGVSLLKTMKRLRGMRKSKIEQLGKAEKPCWSSRHSWHAPDSGLDRCLRIKGECSGSCPNLGWGDPLYFDYRDINPYMAGNHLTGNIAHVNPKDKHADTYKYRVMTDDGVKLLITSSEEFSDHELQLAICEVRKMIIDPIKEEEIVLQSDKLDFRVPLPSSSSAIKQMCQFGEFLRIDKALDDRLYQQVVVKELIPGIKPPDTMQLLQQYPRGGITRLFDHEFSPVIREPWMDDCNANISDPYDYGPLEKVCARVTPIVKYPDLSSLRPTGLLEGERFQVEYDKDSGIVGAIKARSDKYTPVEDVKSVLVAGEKIMSNIVIPDRPHLKKKYVLSGKKRMFIERCGGKMVPVIYYIMMLALMVPMHDTSFICGDDKHGTLWSLPTIEDCEVDKGTGDMIEADVYTKRYDYNITMDRCYRSERVDTTTYGFFGPKSHLGYSIKYYPVSVDECRAIKANKEVGGMKMTKLGEYSWSTNVKPDVEYTWCCKEVTTRTGNYHFEEVRARVHLINNYAVIIGADSDISHCSYKDGNYTSKTSTYIWDALDISCNIEKVGEGKFTVLADGHLLSYNLQLSLMMTGNETYCGVEYTSTEQGMLIIERKRRRRDVDAGEKNFILKAANEYSRHYIITITCQYVMLRG